MKLTTLAKEKLNTEEARMKVALETGESYTSVRRWITKSHDNLTRMKVVKAIINVTGLREDEIFELEPEENA